VTAAVKNQKATPAAHTPRLKPTASGVTQIHSVQIPKQQTALHAFFRARAALRCLNGVLASVVTFFCPTSKMSHDGSWRDSCTVAPFEIASTDTSTRRDRSRRWLWRLVSPCPLMNHHFDEEFLSRALGFKITSRFLVLASTISNLNSTDSK
jgi:hypothetical protein